LTSIIQIIIINKREQINKIMMKEVYQILFRKVKRVIIVIKAKKVKKVFTKSTILP
jgi:hypothetical protein